MQAIRELFTGLFAAIASSVIVLAAISLTAAEGMSFVPSGTQAATATSAPPPAAQEGAQQGEPLMATPTVAPTSFLATAVQPTTTSCAFPAGWIAYTIQAGDTVEALAEANGITAGQLAEANCLWSNDLPAGSVLYLPAPELTATPSLTPFPPMATMIFQPTPAPCGPPFGWVRYIVQPGETLFQLSMRYGVSVPNLQAANCLGSSNYIQAGQVLYVPNVAPIWPTATFTTVATWTKTPVPPTPKPTTAAPTTAVPTTNAVPTTAVPTTAEPTTAVPTTAVPTTAVPTSAATIPVATTPAATAPAPTTEAAATIQADGGTTEP